MIDFNTPNWFESYIHYRKQHPLHFRKVSELAPELLEYEKQRQSFSPFYQALQRSETVIIAGDGRYGRSGVTLPFYGGQFVFRPGAAELALQTGARLAAVFSMMAVDGQINFEIHSLPMVTPGSHEAQVEALTRVYSELLLERWPQLYSSHQWGHLRGSLKRTAMQLQVTRTEP